ncbi:Amino acid permease [Methanosarcina lacustris Z-7289]|uniref:Amino acid permease n=1 Tax=Methanosarcina lacustris Z-7289 TaxID=1434111 RepID=A0A0E3S3L1_9EURY|nr:amino acid permease [Methanosarcina lacustris]AKB75559.1 Amino acid permease [Methanosarcina lacustris Z-7289]
MAPVEKTERLGRNLGFFSTFAIGTGTMIGAGIFILPGLAVANAGPGAIIAFLLGGLISIATAISMSELATGMPVAGGSYYYISRTMGAAFGAVIGLGSWLALIFKGTFALIGLAQYTQIFYPLPLYLVAAVTGVLLLVINYRGAKSSGSLQNITVIVLLVILVLFIGKVSFLVKPENFIPVAPHGIMSIFTTTGIIFISYLGLAEAAAVSEEVKNPSKNLPRAFIASAVVVTIFYVGIIAVVVGFSGPAGAVTTVTPLADIAGLIAGNTGKYFIAFAALLATLSTANGAILSSSRFPFAMSRDALMPEWFVTIHKKYETPHNAILITGSVMVALLFFFNIEQLARLGGAFNILIFILLNVAVIILRKRTLPGYEPTFRDPLYPFTQIFGVVGSMLLLPLLGGLPLLFTVLMIFAGAGWYMFYGKGKAMPAYNLFDLLENNVERVSVEPTSVGRVLVPVSNPGHERDLLKLADFLGNEIICLHVIEVPEQTTLMVAQEAYHEKQIEMDCRFQEDFEHYPAKFGNKREFIFAFDHDISNSIIEQAEIEHADIIIMGWHESKRFKYSFGDVTNDVLLSSKSQIALLKGHLPDSLKKILVAYNGKQNSVHGLYLAKKLAANTGASIRIISIISPDEDPENKAKLSTELEGLVAKITSGPASFKMLERYSIEDAILEVSNGYDLTIIGDSSERFKISLLGTLSQRIARHSKKPIMIVKKSKPISKESMNYLLKKSARKIYARLRKEKYQD